jgi:hypothetical protein
VYDPKNDRLLVLSQGCNEPPTFDGGAADAAVDGDADGSTDASDAGSTMGPLVGRLVEQVTLADNRAKVLYDATNDGFPSLFAYADDHHAWIQFAGVTRAWDPTTATLGATLASAPDTFVYDGKGSLVGPKGSYLSDGGFGGIDIVSVSTADGGVTTIGSSPVSTPDPMGYFSGVDLWPR